MARRIERTISRHRGAEDIAAIGLNERSIPASAERGEPVAKAGAPTPDRIAACSGLNTPGDPIDLDRPPLAVFPEDHRMMSPLNMRN